MRRRARRHLRRMRHRQHLHALDSRASRWPMASATAPPTPVSISSKTSVGAEPRSASATFSASRKRESSPPDATFIIGPGRVPGLVRTQNSTWSMPSSVRLPASLVDRNDELGALELQRRQFRHHGSRQRDRRGMRAVSTAARRHDRRPRARRRPASPAPCSRSSPASRSARSAAIVSRSCARSSTGTRACARRRAARTAAPRPFQPLRVELVARSAASTPDCAASSDIIASSSDLTTSSSRPGASVPCAAAAATGWPAAATARLAPTARPAHHGFPTAIFSARIIVARSSASCVSSPGCGIELRQLRHRGAQIVCFACRRLDLGAVFGKSCSQPRQ